MNFATRNAALNAYGKRNLATEVETASPHRLIVMLFEGAIAACHMAKLHMQSGAIADKGMAISKAIAIIQEGLLLSLDREQGGELATNLASLYDYMGRRLIQANIKNDPASIDEVLGLLIGLKESWEQIAPSRTATTEPTPPSDRNTSLSYGKA